jgi:DNA-binding response OmpR family regulator
LDLELMASACIAVIDDDAATRMLMHELLAEESFDVVLWTGDDDPVAFVERTKPDLVILDLHLHHERQADDVIAALCGDDTTVTIPVIICSADATLLRHTRTSFEERGCVIVEKPFSIAAFVTAVRQNLPPGACND